MKTTDGLRPQEHGGALRNGGTNKGGTGRPPAKFKAFLAKLRENPKLHRALTDAVTDPESKGFSSALKVLTDYDDEKPAQRISIDTARIKAMSDEELAAIVAGKR